MIPYTYKVVQSDEKGSTLLYKSPGYPDMLIGVHTPVEGESRDAVAAMYAPIANWRERDVVRVPMDVGAFGSFMPPQYRPVTLESAKSEKLAELAAWRYTREVGGILVGRTHIRTDRETQAAVAASLTTLREALVTHVDWKTAEGVFVRMDLEEVTAVAQAVARHVQACFSIERTLAEQIQMRTTIEEVQTFQFPDVIA